MCGIAGIFNFDARQPVDEVLLRAMNAAITHRGPDEDGFYVNGPLGMANRRLSIIGLADGRQPIANEDETVWTVFNGEIYNYPDLRRELEDRGHRFRTGTDTEVLVHLYEEEGEDFVERLNGMFAIALWDDRRRRLLIYRVGDQGDPARPAGCAHGESGGALRLPELPVQPAAPDDLSGYSPTKPGRHAGGDRARRRRAQLLGDSGHRVRDSLRG